jgi:threonine/homoserine/homoserine lactone efflux protein
MRWQALASLVVASLAVMGSPGPATISLTAAGSAHGVRRSLGYLAGIVAGTTVVLLAVATGITAALLAVPAVQPLFLAASAGYILWLAYHIATAPAFESVDGERDAPGAAGGLFLGVTNPKAWLAIAGVFAGARLADGAASNALAKVAVLAAMIVLINATWLVAGASLAGRLRDPRRARTVNLVLAAALVASLVVIVRG